MMSFMYTQRRTEIDTSSSSEKQPEEALQDVELLTFEIEEFVIEHFREDDLSERIVCV